MAQSFSHTVNSDQATFLGFALEAITYGIYIILFFVSITVLIRRKPALNASKTPMFAVACFMFSLCTVHFSLNFHNVYNSLMVQPRPHISAETHLLAGADMLFSITDFCSQLILIYRCYVVWGRTIWVIIFPMLMACTAVACGVALIGLILVTDPNAPQSPAALVPLGTSSFAISLSLNFIVSALIVGRIWYLSRNDLIERDTGVRRAAAIVIESGLLFLWAQFVFTVLFAIAHPAQAIVEPVATQIYGISPTLIIVRVGLGSSFEPTHTAANTSSLRFDSFRQRWGINRTGTSDELDTQGDIEMQHPQKDSSKISEKAQDDIPSLRS